MSFGLRNIARFQKSGCFRLWTKVCLVILLGLSLQSAESQRFQGRLPFKVYGPDQGLKGGTPTDIAFDAKGFMWLGTEGGLFRYEGSHFRKQRLGNETDSWIQDVLPSRQGGLWVSTNRGFYHYKDGIATPVDLKSIFRPSLALDRDGDLWALVGQNVWKEDGGNLKPFVTLKSAALSITRTGSSQIGVGSGRFYIIGDQQIWFLKNNRLEKLDIDIQGSPLGLREDETGCLWVATETALYQLAKRESKARNMSHLLPGPFFKDGTIQLDPMGRVWIPTYQGFLVVKGDDHELIRPQDGLPMTWVRQGLHDPEGNLWVIGSKLARLQGQGRVRNHGLDDGLPVEIAWTFYQDREQRLWAGTQQGLCRLGRREWELQPATKGSDCHAITEDGEGNLWIGGFSTPLRVLRKGQSQIQEVKLQMGRIKDAELAQGLKLRPNISCMLGIGTDLWIAVYGVGLLRVDPKTATILGKISPADRDSAGIYFQVIRKDAKNRIWLSSRSGLFCRLENGQWLRMKEGLKQPELHGLELCPDPDEVWVHYDSANGLSRVRLEGGRFTVTEHVDESKGLISNNVLGTARGKKGELWISTDQGVDCYDQGRFTHFGLGRGISAEDGCEHALFVGPEGDVWVGTSQGISHIRASSPMPPQPAPICHLTALHQGGKALKMPFPLSPRIKAQDATLEFRFESPTYRDESRLRYQVRMVGLEPEWRDVEEHSSRYTSIKGGDYIFEVRAGILGEDWGPATSYAFTVLSPWWERWWAIGLGLLALSQGIWYITRMRMRQLIKEKARSEALLVQKTQDLQIASHHLVEANKALETMSLVDPLTGLSNRRYLSSVITLETSRVLQVYRDAKITTPLPNQDLIIYVINLDKLSFINEQYGHAAGDAVLKRTAYVLKSVARETDWVIRMSGDSFVLLARSSSRKDASVIAERIKASMESQKLPFEKLYLDWTCSIGFAPFPFQLLDLDWMGWERVLELTDACLCMAKDAGRNTWLGLQAKPELTAKTHGPQLPWEMQKLIEEGVLELYSNCKKPFPNKRKRL